MTREQKIEWLEKATAEQLIEQLRWSVVMMQSDSINTRVEANDDYALVKAELLKRMA